MQSMSREFIYIITAVTAIIMLLFAFGLEMIADTFTDDTQKQIERETEVQKQLKLLEGRQR